MDSKETAKLLRRLRVCPEMRKWAAGKTLAEIWDTCKRGDWLLWLCESMVGEEGWPTLEQVVLAACDCAELARPYVKNGRGNPRRTIEVTRKWAKGEASMAEVRDASDAADDAAHAAASDAVDAAIAFADSAAASAAYADAGAAAAAAEHAADAVAGAARIAYADSDAAAKHAKMATLKQCADLVRARLYVPAPEREGVNAV